MGAMATAFTLFTAIPASAASPAFHARALMLLDGVSGQVLYQQNGFDKAYPASTTKLLTALVAVEHGDLSQSIRVSAAAVNLPPDSSSCYLNQGEEQRLEYLLYGLLLSSGNDCAMAIAEGVGGGQVNQFVAWMNETAKQVGATHSNFMNPHGLHDPNHYTTPYDLAMIAKAALANPTLLKIAGTKQFYWPGKSELNGIYYNHNQLLSSYNGVIGGKNGFTEEAELTLVEAAKRGDRLLIGVEMGETLQSYQYNDMKALLDYGFDQFEQKPVVAKGAAAGSIPVTGGRAKAVPVIVGSDFLVSAPKGEQPKIATRPTLQATTAAPVTAGQTLGTLEVRDGDRVLGTVPIVAQMAVGVSPFTLSNVAGWAGRVIKWLALTFLGLLLFRTAVKAIRRLLRRRRKRQGASVRSAGPAHSASLSASRGRSR